VQVIGSSSRFFLSAARAVAMAYKLCELQDAVPGIDFVAVVSVAVVFLEASAVGTTAICSAPAVVL
jgi:hypothetical protein